MIFNKSTAKKTAEVLLQINAIKLNPRDPFTWASGWKSPIYCDNRMVLSYPTVRNFIKEEIAKNLENEFGKPDVIAGVATGAIGIGALVAGKSSLVAVDALKSAGVNVKGMVAIFTYGFDISRENFKTNNVNLFTLSNYESLLEQALNTNFINQKELKILSKWNTNPSTWNNK